LIKHQAWTSIPKINSLNRTEDELKMKVEEKREGEKGELE